MHVACRGGAVPQSSAKLCFVNTRVNFAQGTSLQEMLREEIRVCNVICAAGVCIIHSMTKHTEICSSWSMSEQALQGQLIQGSSLQNRWGKQKTDVLQGIRHLSFTGASLSGDHSAALQHGWCKSDSAVLPWWVTTPGQSSFKLTSDQRSQAKDTLPPLHSIKFLTQSCAGAESSRFSLSRHISYASQKTRTQWAGLVFVTWCRGKGVQTSGRDVKVMSWPWAFPAWALEWQELVWHQTQLSRAGAAAVGAAAACVLCWCS